MAGLTPYPDQEWMERQTRKREHEGLGFLAKSRCLLHDGDGKFCPWFREVIGAGQGRTLQLPA